MRNSFRANANPAPDTCNPVPDPVCDPQYYKQYYDECKKEYDQIASICSRMTLWRTLSFLIGIPLLYNGYAHGSSALCACGAALIIVFLLLVCRCHALCARQRFLADCQSVAQDYLARFDDGWKQFPVHGTRYLHEERKESADLDLFGRHSLYQYICTASTIWGQDRLAHWLNHPTKQAKEILSRQQAVKELAEKPAFTMRFEALARILRDLPYEEARRAADCFFEAHGNTYRPHIGSRVVLRLFPAATLFLLFASLLETYRQYTLPVFFLFACFQLFLALLCYSRNNRVLSPVYSANRTAAPYRRLLESLEQESFDSPYLCGLQKELCRKNSASAALKELESITQAVVIRHNIYAFLLYNCLFLYDFRCVIRYRCWQKNYAQEFRAWMEVIGKIEALISLGVVSHTRQTHTLPELSEPPCPQQAQASGTAAPMLQAEDLKHPLIGEPRAVGNDIDLRNGTCLITGSNMSGKTTFMRSIGVNLVLAYAGGYCTARRLCVSIMEVCTSMRAEDNVNEGISTFYAELLRIKHIIGVSQKQQPMIALIDEIYTGTNSKDRIFAAKETVRNLSRPYAIILLSTHDFELCDLESDKLVHAKNYYFTEHYNQNQILFDYKIRKGRCQTTNALHLLRMAGILGD